MNLELKQLQEISCSEIIALNTNSRVVRHMPLAYSDFNEEACRKWLEIKEAHWEEYGYGHWAFLINGKFAGWGGFEYEAEDADLGLVLHPDYWGVGKYIFDTMIKIGFQEMGFSSITILLPPSRVRIKAILRLGFQPDGEVNLQEQRFLRYRLYAS